MGIRTCLRVWFQASLSVEVKTRSTQEYIVKKTLAVELNKLANDDSKEQVGEVL